MNDITARGKKQIYILKPDAGCQGRGIKLVQGKEEALHKALKEMDSPNIVAQHYLPKPLLINGYKFDMRIYVLVSEGTGASRRVRVCRPVEGFHEGKGRMQGGLPGGSVILVRVAGGGLPRAGARVCFGSVI